MMKKAFIFIGFATLIAYSHAQSAQRPAAREKVPVDSIFRTPVYLQEPSPTSMTVMWLTHVPSHSWVEYGTDTLNMKRAHTLVEGIIMANNTINRIVLRNLEPGTRYYYRVYSREVTLYMPYRKEFGDTAISPLSYFTTWDDAQTDFTAVIFNDLHDRYPVLDRLSEHLQDIPYDVVFFNGDCISDAQTEAAAVRSIAEFSRRTRSDRVPSIYVRGNHEARGAYSLHLWDLLGLMDGRPFGAFNLGDTRFVLLDAGEDKPDDSREYFGMNDFSCFREEQAEFLKRELASKTFQSAARKVLIHHIPAYGWREEDGRFSPALLSWGDILATAQFDIALNAHTHRYDYHPKGTRHGNNYPVMVGGGNNEQTATVAILRKQGDRLTLTVLNAEGETLLMEEL